MQIKDYNQVNTTKVIKKLDLIIPAQSAKLTPPVGPLLGQVKIKVKDFCTLFNDATASFKVGLPFPVSVFVYKNDTFSFIIKTPIISFLLKATAFQNSNKVLSLLDIYKIAKIKKLEFNHIEIENIFKNVLLTAKLLKIKLTK
jgi:large subunit ribosomal protein L11